MLVACVLAAELPDLDYLWPAENSVLHSLQAHRGLSHALIAVPLVSLIATAISKLVFRRAPLRALFSWSLPSVGFAHLFADAWTGWGTRLLLPFSDARVTLDWMMVVDPLFTLPLLLGVIVGLKQRSRFRRAVLFGAAVAGAYLLTRVIIRESVSAKVAARYPDAESVQVFPSWIGPTEWRYVAVFGEHYAVGRVGTFAAPQQQASHRRARSNTLSPLARSSHTVQEALAWARFPIVEEHPRLPTGTQLSIADLRYHLNGTPTLTFQIELDEHARVLSAVLDRGGSARSLWERFRSWK